MRTIEEKIREWEKETGVLLCLGEESEGTWIDSFFYRGREIIVKAKEKLTEREVRLVRWGLESAMARDGGMERHPLWTLVRGESSSQDRKKWIDDWGLTETGMFRVAFFHFHSLLDQWHRESLMTLLEDEGVVAAGAGQDFLLLLQRDDWEQWLKNCQGTAEAEWMTRVLVTVGLPVEKDGIAASYQEAKSLMALLQEDPMQGRWMTFESAELSFLIYRLKPEDRRILLLRAKRLHLEALEEEEWMTALAFWKHQLHLSQTASALFIHRNTLNYRLERIRKKTGLDLRVVHDAIQFQIAREAWELEKRRQKESGSHDTV